MMPKTNTYYFNVRLQNWNHIGTITIEANSLAEAQELARNIISSQLTFQGLDGDEAIVKRQNIDILTRFPITISNHMKTILENYINGNLTDARKQAFKYSSSTLFRYFHQENGYTVKKAHLLARYLKTGEGFQELCDCK